MSAPEKKVLPSHSSNTARMRSDRRGLRRSASDKSGAHVGRDGVDGRIVDDDQRQLAIALDANTTWKTSLNLVGQTARRRDQPRFWNLLSASSSAASSGAREQRAEFFFVLGDARLALASGCSAPPA